MAQLTTRPSQGHGVRRRNLQSSPLSRCMSRAHYVCACTLMALARAIGSRDTDRKRHQPVLMPCLRCCLKRCLRSCLRPCLRVSVSKLRPSPRQCQNIQSTNKHCATRFSQWRQSFAAMRRFSAIPASRRAIRACPSIGICSLAVGPRATPFSVRLLPVSWNGYRNNALSAQK